MHDLSFTLTKDLVAALVEITGAEPTRAEPVVVLAAYIDALAKEYGLSESLNLDVDPVERTQQVAPVMEIINHYFTADEAELDADEVRACLYDVFTSLAADSQARRILNRNEPLTENRTLHLAQIYWNLEATPGRPKLPIHPRDGRDIPVPGITMDFATMRWTARVNQKGNYKSSGQSFRTQGARLAVLAAQHITAHSVPVPESTAGELDVHRTQDPEEPVEITLKELVWRAWNQGNYDDAVELSTSYLSIVQRRADTNPFELEPELAGAYLLRGSASLRPTASWKGAGFDVGEDALDVLEKAARSFTTLSELDPQNDKHQRDLFETCIALRVAYEASGRLDEAVQVAERAVSIADRTAATQAANIEQQEMLRLALMALSQPLRSAGRFENAAAAMRRAITVAEELVTARPSEVAHKELLVSLLWGLSQDLRAAGRFDEAVHAATRAVAVSEHMASAQTANQKLLGSSFLGLSQSLRAAGRFDDAVAAAARAVTIAEQLASSQPANAEYQLGLVASLSGLTTVLQDADRLDEAVAAASRADTILESLAARSAAVEYQERLGIWTGILGRLHRQAGRYEDAVAAANRAIEIFRQLAATETENLHYRSGLGASLDDLSRALRALGRFDQAEAVDDALRSLGFE